MLFSGVFDSAGLAPAWQKTARGLLLFYLSSLFALTFAGLIFKGIFYLYNMTSIGEVALADVSYALFWGLRFDLAIAAMFSLIMSLLLWGGYRLRTLRAEPSNARSSVLALSLFFISLIALLSLQTGDAMYFVDAGRHVSYEMRDVVTDAFGLLMTALTQHWPFILISLSAGLVTITAILFVLRRIFARASGKDDFSLPYNLQYEAIIFLIMLLSVILIRGGITGLPQSVISAFKIGDSRQAIVAMNGAYSIVYGALNSSKEIHQVPVKVPETMDVKAMMHELYPLLPDQHASVTGEVKNHNIVFILLEGWPAELMKSYGYDFAVTPFFDSLVEKSLAPLGVIAGGTRTTEGMFTTFCSQQNPLGGTVAQTSLQNFKYECLPHILREQGWHTAFFQGSHEDTSGTGAFAQSLGMIDSFAKEHMPAGRYEHNYWGAHDPDIYDFALDKIDSMPQPFMVGINTNSTHDIELPEGVKPHFDNVGDRDKKINILHFADEALAEFFAKLKSKPYYDNTIFVLLSDHTSGKRSSALSRYVIPAVIYSEALVPAGRVERYVSQRDFAPTVLDLLNFEPSTTFAGKSLYANEADEYFSEYYTAGSVGWLSGDFMVETNVGQPGIFKCFSLEKGFTQLETAACGERGELLSRHSLVFTAYSQNKLFKGETQQFYEFLAEQIVW